MSLANVLAIHTRQGCPRENEPLSTTMDQKTNQAQATLAHLAFTSEPTEGRHHAETCRLERDEHQPASEAHLGCTLVGRRVRTTFFELITH